MTEKIIPSNRNVTIILTLEEHEVLKNICMEVLGNYKWKISRKRALIIGRILDKLEEASK